MDVRTPFFQNIACVLIGVLFLNPIVTTAAELALDAQSGSNAAVTQAANGVPMVNIATPNGSGLSHNKFTDFNVSQQGLILNNSAQAVVQTQLGGYVMGNPNLTGGAANIILNEVNGGSPSQLKGYTEVAGKSAAVIVANPHGISCDGCGFINTPRVTLSTGKPVVEGGRLDRFDVDGGQISIEGDGLNARNVSQFDLITRSAQINAELHASQLNVITGRNDVDAANLSATAKADDGSAKPQLAIDSSALGGMYAGAIRLVGTEAGVGVKLAGDMAASAGDIQIDANGQLSMARTAASRDLQLKAENIELNADTFAGRNAVVGASGQTLVKESLAATQQLTVKGGELLNQGVVEAGVRADGSLNNTATLSLQTSTVTNPGTITSHGNLNSDVQTLDNRAGKLLSAGDATLNAQTLENQGGRIVAQKDLELSGNQLNNQSGEVLAQQTIKVTAANLDNQDGTVAGDALDLQLSANLNNQNGLVESASDLQLAANTLSNNGGKLRALGGEGESRFVLGGLFNNDAGLVEIGSGAFALSSVGLSNLGGTVRHVGDQGFAIDLTALGQAGGRFITNGAVDLSLDEWSNISSLQAKTLNISINRLTQSATGALLAVDGITTSGERWENHGRIETDGALHLTLSDAYTGNGKLLAQGDLGLTAGSADLGSDAEVRSAGGAQFDIGTVFSTAGKITAVNDVNVKAASLSNLGTLGSAAALHIEAAQLINQGGLLFSGNDMQLLADSLSNLYADIFSLGALTIAKDAAGNKSALLENRSGSIESSGDMSLRATTLTNRKEVFTPGKQLTAGSISVVCYDCSGDHHNVDYVATERFNITVDQDSAASRIHSGGNLTIQGDTIANRYSSLSASANINITGITLENMGAASGIIERTRRFNTGRVTDGTDERFRDNHINPYNAAALPKEVPSALYAWTLTSDIETQTPNGSGAPAIIQAGGNVSIQATQSLTNSSVLNNQAAQAGTAPGLDTQVTSSSQPLIVQLNAQLPADSQQLVVDPLAQPSFSLPQGQNGLFQLNNDPGYPYLIETNPAFASLSNFLNSGYLLDAVGYNPDQTQRRLGDGLYEQRLIQQAIAARTGKRFLAGLNSDEAQFKYLMDNAIASKQALNLAPGIALTAEQVAALTHDIVWMQEQVVNGQKVLVPVLYLAQANDRLAPGGALIQGQDVALISGSNLNNSGTLRASKNLSATANNIGNSGLMQAGERLALLATDSIRNARGGLIAGKDVTAIALTGDISNERTITQEARSGRNFSQLTSVVDKAAGFEASNNLSLSAGRDIQNIGGSLKAGGNADLSAGQDLIIASAEAENGQMRKDKRHFWSSASTTQYGSDVQVGGDLAAEAGRDLAVIASKVKAGGDVDLLAERDVMIGAAANQSSSEYRYNRGSKKKINQENTTVRQQMAEIEAGGDLLVIADNDLTLSASKLKAGDEAYLYAGSNLSLLTEANQDYSFYSKSTKKSGSFGRSSKKSVLSESESITSVGSSVTANSAVLTAGKDLRVIGSSVEASAGDVSLSAANDILIGHALDSTATRQASSSSKSSWGGLKSSKLKHDVKESSTQAVGSLISGDNVELQAGRDVQVTASGVVSTDDLNILAARDIKIDAATNTFSRDEKYKSKNRDLTGLATGNNLGLDDITGNQHLSISKGKGNSQAEETTLTGSTVGSSEGSVSLTAGRKIGVVASDLVSTKDMSLTASDVSIVAGIETAKQSSKDGSSSLAVGRVVGGSVVDTVQSIYDTAKAANEAEDSRLKAVKTAQALLSAYSAAQQGDSAAANIADGKPANSSGSLIKIGSEVAHTRSKSSSEYSAEQVKQSNLNSGGTLSIVASGAEASSNGDIHVVGSALKAADTELLAKRDIVLESAQNSAEWNNQSKTNRTSVGASFNIGQQNGFTLDLGAKLSGNTGKGHDITQVNSTLNTGSLLLVSGKDTTLAGAQVRADKVDAAIGGDLNIASRQDEAKNKNEQKSAGFGASICIPPFCYGATVSGTASLAGGKTSTDYQAVTEQSGIYAGKGGYDITVGDTTRLQGAVIASEATADKNRLSTDRLEHSDIRNRSEIKSQSASLSVSYSSSGETKGGDSIDPSSSLGGGLPLALKESDRSTTKSAVSAGTLEVRNTDGANDLNGLSRETAGANQQLDRPDEKAMQERMDLIQSTAALGQSVVSTISQAKQKDAQEKLKQADKTNSPADKAAAIAAVEEAKRWDVGGDMRIFANITTGLLAAGLGGTGAGTTAGIVANTTAADTFKRIGDYADKQSNAATDEATKAAWAEGGIARILLHATAGAIQGLAGGSAESGALGAGLSAAVMPAIGKALEGSGLSESDSNAVATLIATGMGVAAGSGDGTAGQVVAGGSAGNVDLYNRQLHPDEKALAKRLAEKSGGKYTAEQIEEQLRLTYVLGTDITPGSDIVVRKDGIYDAGGNWIELGNGLYLQDYSKLDVGLVAFIQGETNQYHWAAFPTASSVDWSKVPIVSDEKRDRLTGYVLDDNGRYRVPTMVDGKSFSPRFFACGDAECAASGSNIDHSDPETRKWIAAGNAEAAEKALAAGSLVPLPTAWIGRFLGNVIARGSSKVAVEAVVAKAAGPKAIDDSAAYTKWWDNVAQPKTLTDREARAWYLSKEAEIPSRIDAGLSLEDQAKQAFAMRNDLRSTARELMSNRHLADSLNKSDPNRTWSEIANKYSSQGLSGDDLWRKIIEKSQSSRTSVNNGLGM
jgi:filamentous hemagglutinin